MDLDELEAKARAEREACERDQETVMRSWLMPEWIGELLFHHGYEAAHRVTTWLEVASPATVLALIERVRRAEADYQEAREQLGRQAAVWWRLEQEKTTALVAVSAALGEDSHITLLDVGERVRDRIARLERVVEAAEAVFAAELVEYLPPDEVYGAYPGGDPRLFQPDEDCSTEEERAAHRAACDAWDRGDTVEVLGGCETTLVEPGEGRAAALSGVTSGAPVASVTQCQHGDVVRAHRQPFGLGIYRIPVAEAVDALRAALDAAKVDVADVRETPR